VRTSLCIPVFLLAACAEVPITAPTIDIPELIPEILNDLTQDQPVNFASEWQLCEDADWIGPEFWANRLQDWELAEGHAVCRGNRLDWRTLHLLSHQLKDSGETAVLRVTLGVEGSLASAPSFGGLLLGAGAADLDYRAASLVQSAPGPEGGILAGIDRDGHLVLRDFWSAGGGDVLPELRSEQSLDWQAGIELRATIRESSLDDALVDLLLEAFPVGELAPPNIDDAIEPAPLARVEASGIAAEYLVGNVAMIAQQKTPNDVEQPPHHWFADFSAQGLRMTQADDREFGPILGAQHTLSRGTLKMTVQLPPLGTQALAERVQLQLLQNGIWEDAASSAIVSPGWTAHFRLDNWDSTQSEQYRVRMNWRDEDWSYNGSFRIEPNAAPNLKLAALSCNHNNKHGFGREGYAFSNDTLWFPHAALVDQIEAKNPDLLFFAGDQIYEGASPTFPDRKNAELDYSYKWFLWHWAFRDLYRDRPVVTIPDDHDVYQGNLWGQGGRAAKRDHNGGYVMPAEFVRMVERTQTSHLPDPWSALALEQGISSYYTDMLYGRVSFAILEDRKFKSGPAGLIEHEGPRPDHITDPAFDPVLADVPTAQLLGEEQLRFLNHWAADWDGVDLKATLSATAFAGLATHHGPAQDFLRMDLDSNGWPQSGRRKALEAIRRGFAVMIAGDQHLASIAQHGVDQFDDAGFSYVVPAIANFYARAWKPRGEAEIPLSEDDPLPYTGSYYDGFGNPVTVYAHTNPGASGHEPASLHDQNPGWGMVRFRKLARSYVFEAWPRWDDDSPLEQYPGWPFQVQQLANGGPVRIGAWLPNLRISGMRNPVLQVIDSFTDEVIYTFRVSGQEFQPPVPEEGKYIIRIGDLGAERTVVLEGVRATEVNDKELIVDI